VDESTASGISTRTGAPVIALYVRVSSDPPPS
jgi:hypothetical protein